MVISFTLANLKDMEEMAADILKILTDYAANNTSSIANKRYR